MCKTHCGLWLVGWYDSGVTGRSSLCNRWARPAVFRLFRLIYSNKLWYPNLKVVPFLDVKTLGADQKSYNWKFEKKRGRFRPRTAWLRRYFACERKTKGGVISTLPNFKFLFFSDLRLNRRGVLTPETVGTITPKTKGTITPLTAKILCGKNRFNTSHPKFLF